MLRFVLIGASVLGTALVGYFAKRKFFRSKVEDCPVELKVYPPGLRRSKKSRRTQLDEVLNNGQPDESADLA